MTSTFELMAGVFEAMPGLLGLGGAIVQAELAARRGEYLVTLPPQGTWTALMRRTLEVFRSSRSAIDDLAEQHERLKTSLQELSVGEAHYRRLAENVDVLVAEWDTGGRCTYVSPSVERLLGWSASEFVGDPYSLVHPSDLQSTQQALIDRIANGGSGSLRFRLRTRSGDWRWMDNRSRTVEGEGGMTSVATVSVDVTDRLDLEQKVLHSQKMDAAGQVAGSMARR